MARRGNSQTRHQFIYPGAKTSHEVKRPNPGFFAALVLISGLLSASAATPLGYQPANIDPPEPQKELRGAWIATVSNIDWPSTNTLTTAAQKAELLAILDRAKELNLNTLIFQVRPGCDALYLSSLEPWSEYLTGTMGKAPKPFYDPLAFAIEEAHKRGLELHAWFNPFRARHASARSPIAPTHISRAKPHLVREYGKSLWLDPGEKEAQDYSTAVILDVVKRYDVDGVHIDDYFYPYKEKDSAGRELDFPDETSWKRSGREGDRDSWRRENVNVFVHRLHEAIKTEKPWVKFGVSPFGIWRPGNPSQIQGFDAYAKLYADSRKWLLSGWVDYFAPQLYWAIDAPEQSFPVLLHWWALQNPHHCLLAPGMDSTKTSRRWPPEEILNQVRLTRKEKDATGHIHWNMRALMNSSRLAPFLKRELYAEPALVPTLPRLKTAATPRPSVSAFIRGSVAEARWHPPEGPKKPWLWLVQSRRGNTWNTMILPGSKNSCRFEEAPPQVLSVRAIDRGGNVGPAASVQRGK